MRKVYQFIEGNLLMLGDNFKLIPSWKKEQVLWRMQICKSDCVPNGKCHYCGCSVPGKLYSKRSCNDGERFPDMMSESQWEDYKKINNISVEIIKK